MANINVYGTFNSMAEDQTVAKAAQIFDDVQEKTQETINSETSSRISNLNAGDISYDQTQTPDLGNGDVQSAIVELSVKSFNYDEIETVDDGKDVQIKNGSDVFLYPKTKSNVVTYENESSVLTAENTQDAIDFLGDNLLDKYLMQQANYLYLSTKGGVKYSTGTADTSASYKHTDKMKVQIGDIIIAKGYCSPTYSAITVYNSSGTVIKKVKGGAPPASPVAVQTAHYYKVVEGDDSVVITMALGSAGGYNHLFELYVYHPTIETKKIDDDLTNIGESEIDTTKLLWQAGNYTCNGSSPGFKWNTPSLEVCAPIKLRNIPMLRINGMMSSNAAGVNFFDSNMQSIGYDNQAGGYVYGAREPRLVDVPDDCEYIVFTRYKDTATRGDAFLSFISKEKADKLAPQSRNQIFSPFAETFESFNTKHSSSQISHEIVFGKTVDGYSTQNNRRCPAICVTNSGTVLAVCGMSESDSDASNYSALLGRKAQGGSWSYNVVMPYDSTNLYKYMNMAFVIDRTGVHGVAGRIYLFAIKIHIDNSGGNSSTTKNGGYAAYARTDDLDTVYIYSDDDGVTWSNQQSTKSTWDTDSYRTAWVGPASGVQLADGTLVLPAEFISGFANNDTYTNKQTKYSIHAGILYKQVGGDWQFIANMNEYWNNEDFVLEGTEDNTILLNCRVEREKHVRHLYVVDIATGKFTKLDYDFDPWVVCQQSGQKCSIDNKTIYLLSANDPYKTVTPIRNRTNYDRSRMTVWTSKDGIKWARALLIDKNISWGYSGIASYGNVTAMVYEKTDVISSSSSYDYIEFVDLTNANQFLLDNLDIADLPLEQRIELLRETML